MVERTGHLIWRGRWPGRGDLQPRQQRTVCRSKRGLARHFGISFRKARAKFTVERWGAKYSMRRKKDEIFGGVCRFFDTEKRCCTIYEARPSLCRSFPGGRCGYYDFLAFERRAQEDDEFIATTNNK